MLEGAESRETSGEPMNEMRSVIRKKVFQHIFFLCKLNKNLIHTYYLTESSGVSGL